MVAAIRAGRQAGTVAPQHANDQRSEAARLIVERAPGRSQVFFTNGGADAIENAVRMARLHTGRRKVITRYRSYHGNTDDRDQHDRRPAALAERHGAEGVVHIFGPYLYRTAFWSDSRGAGVRARTRAPGAGHPAGGARPRSPRSCWSRCPAPPASWSRRPATCAGVRELCDRYGILWIADEVMSGFGRAGEWFAVAKWDVRARPDHLRQGRELRLRAARRRDDLRRRSPRRSPSGFPGGLTYSGHPLACAAAVANIGAMPDEG